MNGAALVSFLATLGARVLAGVLALALWFAGDYVHFRWTQRRGRRAGFPR